MTELVILHTNDLHAHFQNWHAQVKWIHQRKAELEALGKYVLVIDLGDFADRVHPLMEATDCVMTTPLLEEMGVDMVTIGNNEGLANTPTQIAHIYEKASFDVLVANVKELETGRRPNWAKRYVIQQFGETRIAFFGLTAPFPHCYEPNGLLVEDFRVIVPEILEELAGQVDAIICLSHLGMYDDTAMAQQFPELTLILGAHTHHIYPSGKWVSDTLLTGGGKHGRYAGEATLSMDRGQVMSITDELVDLDLRRTENDLLLNERLHAEGVQSLQSKVVTLLESNLSVHELLTLSLKTMRKIAQCEVAFSYTGLFLKPLVKGEVTAFDLHQCLPHPIHLNRCVMTGKHFRQLLETIQEKKDELKTLAIIGRGFRGKIFGEMMTSGISKTHQGIFVNGRQLNDSDSVTFVCPDHMRFVEYFPEITNYGHNEIIYPELLRHVLEKALLERRREDA